MIRMLAGILLLLLAGCATKVEPWQKQYLAKSAMTFGQDPAESRISEHIYASREAGLSGRGVGGGGCGCN